MAFDSVKSTFGEYLSGKVEVKSKFIANNISILRKHEFNEELLNTAIYKAVFHYKIPDEINNDSILKWITEKQEKILQNNKSAKANWKLQKKIKETNDGTPELAKQIAGLNNIKNEIESLTMGIAMATPDVYNNIREARREIMSAIRHLLRANKEFIPKESE